MNVPSLSLDVDAIMGALSSICSYKGPTIFLFDSIALEILESRKYFFRHAAVDCLRSRPELRMMETALSNQTRQSPVLGETLSFLQVNSFHDSPQLNTGDNFPST